MAGGFHTITLGCKANQFDGAAIDGELTRRGLRPLPRYEDADVVVVNTCTVTHRADAGARKLIRAVRRANPACKLVVTGCYAELEPETLRAMPEVDGVFGNAEKARWGEILDGLGLRSPAPPPAPDRGCDGVPELPALHFGERSRAFLKVQDGCRLACSYCIIPAVRGASRSVPPRILERAFVDLLRRGFREVVLTGINTGDYGRDLSPRTDLVALLRRLLAVAGPNRLRLNSLEPLTIGNDLIGLLANEPRLASHLQVPLQSGCDTVLRRMRRNYRTAAYARVVERLAARVPGIALGADVIVGFPGETDDAFERSRRFIAASPLSYLHVFAWSPRPGTPAANLGDRVPPGIIAERSRVLRSLAAARGAAFRRRFVGRRLDAVGLGADGERALTGNYIDVRVPGGGATGLVEVELLASSGADAHARVVGRPAWAAPTRDSTRRVGAAPETGSGPSAS